MKPIRRAALVLTLAAALLAAAPPVPAAAGIFGDVTIADEIEMGRKFHKMVLERLQLVRDPEVTGYVRRLVKRVTEAMPPEPFPIKTYVINNNAMNAFAVPGGYVYVFSGLLLNLDSEAEVAAVVAHELAHVHHHHVARRMERMQLVNLGALVATLGGAFLGAAGGGGAAGELGGALIMGSQAGRASAFLSYTREMEREADNSGYAFMVDSGYNPQAMVSAFETMRKKKWYMGAGDIPSYLSTHPGLNERIGYVKDLIDRSPEELTRRENSNEAYHRVQALLRAKLADPQAALAHYRNIPPANRTCMDHLGLGLVYERVRKVAKAGEQLDKAADCAPDDPAVNREVGRYWFERGDYQEAGRYLQKAVILNPDDADTLFIYARLLTEIGQTKSALDFYKRALQADPKDPDVRYHYGRALGAAKQFFQAHLQLAYAELYSNDLNKAEFHIDKAASLVKNDTQKEQLDKLKELFEKRS
jgi:predicted Zn-dependent protease